VSVHPRESFELEGAHAQEASFIDAAERGRLHHAWLLTGPEGIGKATFAYRAARRLLGAKADPAFGPLGAAPDDPVSRLVAAQSHPDLLVLEREVVGGKVKKTISAEAARQLPEFFARTPGMAPHRVAIIDSADDLNETSENALLKTLEEPPPRGVLFLVSHAPGGLLPTMRSRCRRLTFPPWSEEAVPASFTAARARRRIWRTARRPSPAERPVERWLQRRRGAWNSTLSPPTSSAPCRRSTRRPCRRWPTASAARKGSRASRPSTSGWAGTSRCAPGRRRPPAKPPAGRRRGPWLREPLPTWKP
jgi:hypothetical protein